MIVCEACGWRNERGARFCVNCRSYLRWEDGAPVPAGTGAPPGTAGALPERRPAEPAPPPVQQEYGVRLELSGPTPPTLPLGTEHRLPATVRNTGTLVDEIVFAVEPPVSWIRVEPARVSLYPGGEQQVTVVLAPPTAPAPPAGTLTYRLVAQSALHPGVNAAAHGSVTVGAVDALAAHIEPVTVVAKTRGVAQVVLRNGGNRPMRVGLFRSDGEPGVRTDLVPDRVELWPGRPSATTVRMRPARLRWRGEPARHPYRLRVQPEAGPPIDLDAAFVQRPLFARWVLPLVLVLLVVPLLGLGGLALSRVIGDLLPDRDPAVVDEQTTPPGETEPPQETVTVPELPGQQVDDAVGALANLGLSAEVVEQPTDQAEPGTVLATDPGPGSEVEPGSTVQLLVATAG